MGYKIIPIQSSKPRKKYSEERRKKINQGALRTSYSNINRILNSFGNKNIVPLNPSTNDTDFVRFMYDNIIATRPRTDKNFFYYLSILESENFDLQVLDDMLGHVDFREVVSMYEEYQLKNELAIDVNEMEFDYYVN